MRWKSAELKVTSDQTKQILCNAVSCFPSPRDQDGIKKAHQFLSALPQMGLVAEVLAGFG